MVHRFTRLSGIALFAAALVSLAAGPSAAVAEARYEFQAWIAKTEAARKAHAAKAAPAGPNKSEPKSDLPDSSKSERNFNCFFVPTTAKPSDTKVSGDAPILSATSAISFYQPHEQETVSGAPRLTPPALHHPAHRAQAPPRA